MAIYTKDIMKISKLFIFIILSAIVGCSGVARKKAPSEVADPFSSYRAYDHFVQGDLFEQAGDLDSASAEYRKALIFDPGSIEIKRSLSQFYFEQRKFDEAAILRSEISEKDADDYNFIGDCLRYMKDLRSAANFYEQSLKIDSTQYVTRSYLAKIMDYLGNKNEAENNLKLLAIFSQNSQEKVEALLDLGSFYLKNDKLQEAFDSYKQANAQDTSDIRPYIGLASINVAKGDTSEADSLYSVVAERNWDDAQVLNSLIVAFFSIRDHASAEKLAARIAELAPNDANAQKRYAMILFGNKQFDAAESIMVDLDKAGVADANIYYYLGRLAQDKKEFVTSEGYYKKSLAQVDTMAETWINLALVTNEQKRYHDALEVMREAYSAVPVDSNAILFYTSVIHARNNHYDLALEGYQRLIQSNPDDIEIRFNLAASLERLGRFEDAENEFKTILKKDPQNAMTLNYLGYMYADKGIKLKEAKELIEKALVQDPENGAFLDSYAWVLYKLGNYDQALVQMKKALVTESEDPLVYDHQGDIYLALEQMEMARQSWSKALELKPDDETIRSKLYPR
jgi:tetratricopeptide (TPR) repeat protein